MYLPLVFTYDYFDQRQLAQTYRKWRRILMWILHNNRALSPFDSHQKCLCWNIFQNMHPHKTLKIYQLRGWLHGEFQPGLEKNAITWEISARAETECEGGNRCFLYLLLYTKVLRMRLRIFNPGSNILAITWGISARSTGLKISSRVAQTGLKFQPGSPGWNFLHVIANSVLQGFYRKPGMNFQPGLKIPM